MSDAVLDASAILAVINQEPGATEVKRVLFGATVSSVNLAEVVSKMVDGGVTWQASREALSRFGLAVSPFDQGLAFEVGALRSATRAKGLSLADRACLALGKRLGFRVYTADRAWARIHVDDVHVVLIR